MLVKFPIQSNLVIIDGSESLQLPTLPLKSYIPKIPKIKRNSTTIKATFASSGIASNIE